jgi:lysophospholipid hydrolase
LARHLQTRRLIAGDTLSLDQDKSFYCVVEGTVQVFAQTGHSPEVRQSTWDNEDMNGYQLLNEVGSGGTLSSLFTILSLFTEDVQMSWQDESPDVSSDDMPAFTGGHSVPKNRMRRANSDVSQFDLGSAEFAKQTARRSSVSSTTSTIHGGHKSSRTPSSTNSGYSTPATPTPPIHHPRFVRPTQEYKGVVARATVDTTLAVIPAEAFRRLTKKFPKATGHIVQGLNHPFTFIL